MMSTPCVSVLTEQGENESGGGEMTGVCFHIYACVSVGSDAGRGGWLGS